MGSNGDVPYHNMPEVRMYIPVHLLPLQTLSSVVHAYLPSYRQETDDPILLGTLNK